MTEQVGLVHTVSNVTEGVGYVCNCCGCCCGILRGITDWGIADSVAYANYYAVIEPEFCADCGTCIERCHVGAISDGRRVLGRGPESLHRLRAVRHRLPERRRPAGAQAGRRDRPPAEGLRGVGAPAAAQPGFADQGRRERLNERRTDLRNSIVLRSPSETCPAIVSSRGRHGRRRGRGGLTGPVR